MRREHQQMFRQTIPEFNEGCERYFLTSGQTSWRQSLRVRPMIGAAGIWEMTWSYSAPDGRATFHFSHQGGEPMVIWRRIGSHRIYRQP
jgi:hypothetical protein